MVGAMETCEVTIGDRVQVGDQRGTVLYVGPVPPTKGTWIGIDWDDPLRGKHNGVYDGIRYFQARYETSGSLIRIEKISPGQTIISAIQERYGDKDQLMDTKEMEEIQKAMNAPLFMMVGFDKISEQQSCFDSLNVIGVREHRIQSAGDAGSLRRMCPNVTELDISRNLINSWQTVYMIASQLPKLEILDLSENRLSYKDCDSWKMQDGFRNLDFIVLSKLEYTWDDILYCAEMWPHITCLQASLNKITSLSLPQSDILHSLQNLNLEGNNILHWSEVVKLGTLPKLEVLNICNIGISNISLPTPNKLFPQLKFILLSENFINNWESISELDKLPNLEEVRLRNNPILEGISKDTVRQIIIARIAKLKMLNTQEVPEEERRGAEIDYLKENGRIWLETALNPAGRAAFNTFHPRFSALIQKFGEVEEAELKKGAPSLKTNLVRVRIVAKDATLERPIPHHMTIRALVFFIQRLFNTGTPKLKLTLISSENPLLQIPLDNMVKSISYYCIEDGDTIRVDF